MLKKRSLLSFLSSLLPLSLLCACGAPPSGPIQTTFDACAALQIVADEAITPFQRSSVEAAIALWNERAGTSLTLNAPSDGQDTPRVPLHFEPAALAFRGLYDDVAGTIHINSELTDPRDVTITVAHEIGHAFGLEHVEQEVRPSVMNRGNLTFEPTAEDVAALQQLWGPCAATP